MSYEIIFFYSFAVILIFVIIIEGIKIKMQQRTIRAIQHMKDTLYSVGDEINRLDKQEPVYSLILDTAVNLIPSASKGSILILEEDGNFHYKALRGYPDELKKIYLKREEIFLHNINNFEGTAIIENPLAFDEDTIDDKKSELLKEWQALDINSVLSSPIYFNNELIGVMNVDCVDIGRSFSKEDLRLMNHIKNELQLFLINSLIQNRLRYTANHDELTGLFSRRYFNQIFEAQLANIKRYRTEGCVVLIDLDNFKSINDNHGHDVGDTALKFFADVLRNISEKSDIYARMSGDEFVMLCMNCGADNIEEKIGNIKEMLKNRDIEGINLKFSYGICHISDKDELSVDDIYKKVDKKMYLNKKSKKILV